MKNLLPPIPSASTEGSALPTARATSSLTPVPAYHPDDFAIPGLAAKVGDSSAALPRAHPNDYAGFGLPSAGSDATTRPITPEDVAAAITKPNIDYALKTGKGFKEVVRMDMITRAEGGPAQADLATLDAIRGNGDRVQPLTPTPFPSH